SNSLGRRLASADEMAHLAEKTHGKVRLAGLRRAARISQLHLAVLLGDLAAQGLVLQAERLALAKISEMLERREFHQRDQPVIPGHAPAIVEKRRREAYHARDIGAELRGEHQREIGAHRKTA